MSPLWPSVTPASDGPSKQRSCHAVEGELPIVAYDFAGISLSVGTVRGIRWVKLGKSCTSCSDAAVAFLR